ncbi:hypothetical protein G4B88_016078 [Cannabis sativa]|uniref:Uncharacterized protein n=1 Tax=Cannabis sativa TaxID=3483 RepID=A0A7J6EXV6_CANSA|nr:hypothetical protein G4B88_016078 [Cannabis sativa]
MGIGDSILVFKDPWLPRPYSFLPTSPITTHPNFLVKDLIEESRTGWNVGLLRALFNEVDQQCIRSIPICKFVKDDAWLWNFIEDGSYSVKSGYFRASQVESSIVSPSKDVFSFLKNSQTILMASEVLSQSEFELFLVATWYIWGERTQVIHGHQAYSSEVIANRIYKLLEEFNKGRNTNNAKRESVFFYFYLDCSITRPV